MRLFVLIMFVFSSVVFSSEKLVLLSTTSLENCGFLEKVILPFERKYNCKVKVLAVGSGQALRLASDGQGDILFSHDEEGEKRFIKKGLGTVRIPIMYNNFILIGPKDNPAGINCNGEIVSAFKKIAKKGLPFVSRGDNSGTHKKELQIWKMAGYSYSTLSKKKWYIESGVNMEQALRITNEKKAYCLVDRATYIVSKKELDNLGKILEGDPMLYNPYSIVVASPLKFPWVNHRLAEKFVCFLKKEEGREIIKSFGVKEFGERLFSLI